MEGESHDRPVPLERGPPDIVEAEGMAAVEPPLEEDCARAPGIQVGSPEGLGVALLGWRR